MTTAAAVIIGNEILSGKVNDLNTPALIEMLAEVGVTLERVVVIADDLDDISGDVCACAARYDHVFTSGGVGPTHDDMTMAGIARGFGVSLVRHPDLERIIKSHWRGRINDAAMKLTEVPEGSSVLMGPDELWPAICFRNVFILAGIPKIFAAKLTAIRPQLHGTPVTVRSVYISSDESSVAAQLCEAVAEHPGVQIGSYPRMDEPDYRVRITVESTDAGAVDSAVDRLLELLPTDRVVRVE